MKNNGELTAVVLPIQLASDIASKVEQQQRVKNIIDNSKKPMDIKKEPAEKNHYKKRCQNCCK